MTIETTVNKHRGALLIAIGGFLVFLYVRHKRQQAAAAAAAQAAADAAAAAQADPGTMDQNTYDKQFSQPAPAYLGSPFSGYGANAPNYPPPTQLQPGNGPASPTPPITFPNPAASSGDSTVGAATGGGAPSGGGTGLPPVPPQLVGRGTMQAPNDPEGHPLATGQAYFVPNNMTIDQITGGAPNPYVASYPGNAGFSAAQYAAIGFTPQTDVAGHPYYARPPGSLTPNAG